MAARNLSDSSKLAGAIAPRTAMWITPHPISPFTLTPTHLAQTTPLIFHPSLCCQITHLWTAPLHPSGSASLRTFALIFLPSRRALSISSVSTPSVSADWPVGVNVGAACQVRATFLNTPGSLGLLSVSLAVRKGPFQTCQSTKLSSK